MSLSSEKLSQIINDINTFPKPLEKKITIIKEIEIKDSHKDNITDLNSEIKFGEPADCNTTINHTNICKLKDYDYLKNNFIKSLNLDKRDEDKSLVYIDKDQEKQPIKESHIELNFQHEQNFDKSIEELK
jgi:hypothetical protein